MPIKAIAKSATQSEFSAKRAMNDLQVVAAGAMIAWLAFGFYVFGPSSFDFGNLLWIEFNAFPVFG